MRFQLDFLYAAFVREGDGIFKAIDRFFKFPFQPEFFTLIKKSVIWGLYNR